MTAADYPARHRAEDQPGGLSTMERVAAAVAARLALSTPSAPMAWRAMRAAIMRRELNRAANAERAALLRAARWPRGEWAPVGVA